MQLLIVDDDPVLLAGLSEVLSLEGHTILESADGVAALQVAIEQHPDVILSDFEMPRMDGLTLRRRLQEFPERLRQDSERNGHHKRSRRI